jgi:opacity protein-like surface antigen
MKKHILPVFILFLMAINAHAQGWLKSDPCCVDVANFYTKIYSGADSLQNTSIGKNKSRFKPGYVIGGSLGCRWSNDLSLEFEYAFRRNDIREMHFFGQGFGNHGHFQTSSYMANLYWGLPISCCSIKPFMGLGVGYDSQQLRSSNSRIIFRQNWNHFSWQAIAGLSLPIFCNTEMSVEYKFHQGGCKFYNHSVGIGLIYHL